MVRYGLEDEDDDSDEMDQLDLRGDQLISNEAMGMGPDIYVPVGQDDQVYYQVLKKLGTGKSFVVYSIWDLQNEVKMAMKIPKDPLPARDAPANATRWYKEQVDQLRTEAENLRWLQHKTTGLGDGRSLPNRVRLLLEADDRMTDAELGVRGPDKVAQRDKYMHMWHKTDKRRHRFTWLLADANIDRPGQVPATHFMLCNVGTMAQVRARCRDANVPVPAVFGARCMLDLFRAWVSTVGTPPRQGLVHGDCGEGNVFLHSADARDYPACFLGDFGDSSICDFRAGEKLPQDSAANYFYKFAYTNVFRQLFHEPEKADVENNRLWLGIQKVLEDFIVKMSQHVQNGNIEGLVKLVEATMPLLEQVNETEGQKALKRKFLEVVQLVKDPYCDILTFNSPKELSDARQPGGELDGLPRTCRPAKLESESHLIDYEWWETSGTGEPSSRL